MGLYVTVSKNIRDAKSDLILILNHQLTMGKDGTMLSDIRDCLLNRKERSFIWTLNGQKHRRDNIITAIACYDGTPVGCALIIKFNLSLYIIPCFRRQGIVGQLLKEIAEVHDIQHKLLFHPHDEASWSVAKKYNIPTNIKEMNYKKHCIKLV